MKFLSGLIMIIVGIALALYIAIWWGVIEPIMSIAEMIDTDTVTAGAIGWEVCKFFFKEALAGIVYWILAVPGMALVTSD